MAVCRTCTKVASQSIPESLKTTALQSALKGSVTDQKRKNLQQNADSASDSLWPESDDEVLDKFPAIVKSPEEELSRSPEEEL